MSRSLPEAKFKKTYLPISEAAKFLGVSVDTIRRWDNSGKLHSRRLDGKNRYFAVVDLEKVKSSKPVTISEASQILHLSISTLRRLEKRGQLKAERNENGERVYPIESLKSFVYYPKKRAEEINITETTNHIDAGSFIGGTIKFPEVKGDKLLNKPSIPREVSNNYPQETQGHKTKTLFHYKKHVIFCITLGLVLGLGSGITLLMHNLISKPTSTPSQKNNSTFNQSVLAETTQKLTGSVSFNLDTFFNNPVTVKDELNVQGASIFEDDVILVDQDLDAGLGSVFASNLLYRTSSGSGILISEGQTPTITNTGVLTLNGSTSNITLAGSGSTTVTTSGSTITISSTDTTSGGDITAVTAGDGLSGGGSSGSVSLSIGLTSSGTSSTTSSASGLELSSGLSLLRGCSDGEILNWVSATSTWDCASGSGASSFTLSGDTGTDQTISNSDTLEIAGGTNGIDTITSATDTITINLDTTEISDATFGSGSGFAWTFNAGATDPIITFSSDQISINSAFSLSDFTSNGGVLYTNASGVLQQVTAGTSTQCLLGGTTPFFGSCEGTGTDAFWQQSANGTLLPNNLTVDLLVGGTATTSAKFGLINVSSGTPTATISAGAAGGVYLNATGTLSTTAMQTLTLGGTTTGDVVLDSGTNVITFADPTTAQSTLTVTGTFTANEVLDANGIVTIGDNGDTVAIDSSDWDISTTGTITGVSLDVEGTGNSVSNIDFDNMQASLDVDEATDINLAANDLYVDLTSSGVLSIRDVATAYWTFDDDSTVDVVFPAAGTIGVDAATTASTTTGGVIDINSASVTDEHVTLNIDTTMNDGVTAGEDIYGQKINLTQNDVDGDMFGLVITYNATTAGVGADDVECLLCLDVAENTASVLSDAIRITSSGNTDTSITTGIDIDDTDIVTDIELQNGEKIHNDTNDTITFEDDDGTDYATLNATTTTLTTGTLTLSGTTTLTSSSLATITSAATLGVSATTLNLGGGAAASIGTESNDNLSLSPHGTGDLRLVNDADSDIIMPNFTSDGGILYTNGSGILAQVAAGSSTQCLLGGTTPSFGNCQQSPDAFWNQNNGAIFPHNSTVDLLLGGTATTSAKFGLINVNNGTPTATISAGAAGGTYLNATGTLTTTAAQALTIGGSSSGGIIIDSGISSITLSDATTFSGLATFNAGATIASGQNLTHSGFTSNGGILYTNGSGVFAQVTAGTSTQCLLGGTTPFFGSCEGTGTDAFWQQSANGALFPNNATVDLLVGGTATTSAKFGLINVDNGTPTATISAGAAGGTYLNATGTLSTTAMQTLTLGSSTTGNVVIDSGTSVISLADNSTVTGTLTITGVLSDSNSALTIDDDLTISTGTTISATSITAFNCTDCIDFDDLETTLDIDETTEINFGTSNLDLDLSSSGVLNIQDADTTYWTFDDDSTVDVVFPAAGTIGVDAATTASTTTGGVIDINSASVTDEHVTLNIDTTMNDGVTAGEDIYGQKINLTQNDVDGDMFGLVITYNATTAGVGADDVECLLCLDVAENTASVLSDAIRITSSGNTDTSITTGIDIDDTDIVTDIELQNGESISNDTDGTITLTAPTVLTSAALTITTTATINGNTVIGNANSDTLTINAGISGTGISFGDSSFANCSALETVSNVLTCGSDGGGATTWTELNGALSPYSTTLDVLIGGTATTSAKFGLINVNNGTPTATISAGAAGGTYLNATGTLSTTAMQTLTLGSSTTGNVVIDSGTSVITLTDATTASSTLTVSGTLTANGLLDANGQIDLGDNGDTVAIDSSDWDISTTGTITGVSLDVEGTGNSVSNIDFDNMQASLDVDEATDINLGTNALTIDLDSTGDFSIRDVTTDIATFADTGAITFAPTSGTDFSTTVASTGDINFTSSTGQQTFTSSNVSGTTTTSGFIFDATAITTGTGMYMTTDSITQGKLLHLATSGNTLTTGTLVSIATTATSVTGAAGTGTLVNLDWSPGSSTTATGDLFALNIGTNGSTTGKLFNILDTSSSIFGVSETDFTTSLPTSFTAAGDVSIAYDLVFTNPTASTIQSAAPLTIAAGETFNSSNLTFQTYNSGQSVFEAASGVIMQGGAYGGRAGLIVNQQGSSSNDIFTASASGTTVFTVANTGAVTIAGAASTAINISNTGVATDISLQNGETISNNTDGTISLLATTVNLSNTTTLTAAQVTTLTCSDCIDFDDILDSPTLDAATDINLSTFDLYVDLTSTGVFSIRDVATAYWTFDDDSTVDVVFPAAGQITFDAAATDTTITTGIINLDVDAGDAAVIGMTIDVESAGAITAGTDITGMEISVMQTDADADHFGLLIEGAATAGTVDAGDFECLLCIDYAENTANGIADYIRISNTGNVAHTAGAQGYGINFTDTDIGIEIRLQNAESIDNDENGEIDFTGTIEFDLDATQDTTIGLCKDTADGTATNIEPAECNGTAGDIAEYYASEPGLNPGDLVVLSNVNGKSRMVKTSTPYNNAVIGVVSTAPVGQFGKPLGDTTIPAEDNPNAIALTGKVPIKVTLENGPIYIGDPLTTSSTPGFAMKATRASKIIGYALESFDGSTVISQGVQAQENYRASSIVKYNAEPVNPTGPGQGKILVFTNLTWYNPDIQIAQDGNLQIAPDNGNWVVLNGQGDIIDNVGAFSKGFIAELEAGQINGQDIFGVNLNATNGIFDNLSASFINTSDFDVAGSLSAGKITTDEIQMGDFKVIPNVNNLEFSSDATTSAVIAFTKTGDATFSGKLTAKNGEFTDTLTVKNLVVENITGLTASSSAIFNLGNGVDATYGEFDFATINSDLTVLGTTTLLEAAVQDILSIGTEMSITSNAIDTLSQPLEIQPLKQADIRFMAGAVEIKTDGTMKVNENAIFAKNVDVLGDFTANKINVPKVNNSILSDTEVYASTSAGTTFIKAGEIERKITTPFVESDSLIYITPVTDTYGQTPFIASQEEETSSSSASFTVKINETVNNDIKFNFLIINQKQALAN